MGPLISFSQESCSPSFCYAQTKTESAINPDNVHDAAFAPELRSPTGGTCRPQDAERRQDAADSRPKPRPLIRGAQRTEGRLNQLREGITLNYDELCLVMTGGRGGGGGGAGGGGKGPAELHTNADKDQSHLKLPHRCTLRRNKMSSSSTAAAPIRRVSSSSFFFPTSPPCLPRRTGGGFLHQKNSWQINALPLGLIKLEGIKTTERLLWWTQCCASCALCSGGNFCHLAGALPAAAALDSL